MGTGDFETAVQRLIGQISHWETGRWQTPTKSGGTRGDTVFTLVQTLADTTADLTPEENRRRPVPRLADTVLPDQLRVMADDLLATTPPPEVLATCTAAVTATRAAL